jgi:hypothetical protein
MQGNIRCLRRAAGGFGLILLTIGLSGCAGLTRAEYANMQKTLQNNAAVKQETIDECVADARFTETIKQRKYDALLGVSLEQTQRIYCKRIIDAVANGQLTFNDSATIKRGDDSKFIRILLGR